MTLRHLTVLLNPAEAAFALKPLFPPSSFFHHRDHNSVYLLLSESGRENNLAENILERNNIIFPAGICTASNANTKEGTIHRNK